MPRSTLPIFLLVLSLALPGLAGVHQEALADAAKSGDLEAVQELITGGLDIDTPTNDYGATALSFAADKGHLAIVRFLVDQGADVNVKDRFYQSTPISWAVFAGHADIVAYLVEHGADGASAARMAMGTENFEVAKAILATGKLTSETLNRLFSMARQAENEEMIQVLKMAGAKLPSPSSFQLSPEALEHYVGSYRLEKFDLNFTISAGDGQLLVHNPNASEPSAYEPLSATTFRLEGAGGAELHFDLKGEVVTGYRFFREGTDEPFQFVRLEPEGEAEAPSKTGTLTQAGTPEDGPPEEGAAQRTGAKPELATPELATKRAAARNPLGAADRNWPAFRGLGAAGTAQGSPVIEWNAKDGTNILWKTPIPGRAHSSPIIWGNRVFVTTAVAAKPEGEFRNGLYGDVDSVKIETSYDWRMYALDRKTGEVLWHHIATEGMPRASHHIKATQANATPVTDGRRVVAILGSEGLYAWDLEGKLLWQRDLGVLSVGWFYDSTYEWGHSSSPILYQNTVIVQVDRHGDPFIAAYSLADGKQVWRADRDSLPSYSTPTLLEGKGGPELITNGSPFIRAYDPRNGKELWHLGPNSELVVGTPVTGQGMAFITGGYTPIRPIYAVRPGGKGDITLADGVGSSQHIVWKTDNGGTYMPTPLIYGDHLYMTNNAGIVTCYNARTGERLYRDRIAGRGGVAMSASPVAADGRIYWVSEDGDGYVAKAGREFELLATNPLDEIVMASPAISGDILFIRSLRHVFAIGKPEEEGRVK
jgi:outer membrane protein assembly factor BamB